MNAAGFKANPTPNQTKENVENEQQQQRQQQLIDWRYIWYITSVVDGSEYWLETWEQNQPTKSIRFDEYRSRFRIDKLCFRWIIEVDFSVSFECVSSPVSPLHTLTCDTFEHASHRHICFGNQPWIERLPILVVLYGWRLFSVQPTFGKIQCSIFEHIDTDLTVIDTLSTMMTNWGGFHYHRFISWIWKYTHIGTTKPYG